MSDIRVEVFSGGTVGATMWNMWDVGKPMQYFKLADDLPQWIKERIAVLKVIGSHKDIHNIKTHPLGKRDDFSDVYYLNKPNSFELGDHLTEKNNDDHDTGKESKEKGNENP